MLIIFVINSLSNGLGAKGALNFWFSPFIYSSTNSTSGHFWKSHAWVKLITDGSAGYLIWNLPLLSFSDVSTKNCGHGYTGSWDVTSPWFCIIALSLNCTLLTTSELGADDLLLCMASFLVGSYFTSQALLCTSSKSLMNASADAIKTATTFLALGLKPNPQSLVSNFAANSAESFDS